MKRITWLTLYLLGMGLLTGCPSNEPPTVVVTPTPTPTVTPTPTPAVTATPAIDLSPIPIPPPAPLKPPVSQIPKSPSKSDLPNIYTSPAPVPILPTSEPTKSTPNPKDSSIAKLNVPTNPAQKITSTGIGAAKIGMTYKELKQKLGNGYDFQVKTSFIDGFEAIAVTRSGKVQYYIPYPAGTKFTNEDKIQHLMTDNPDYRTEKGVGPGTPIGQAESVYGGATLSFSKENESREFIGFGQQPSGLAFRSKPAKNRTFAGEYPESNSEYLKTKKYDVKAAIGQITVSCANEQCGKETE
jgi:hypothetical protein